MVRNFTTTTPYAQVEDISPELAKEMLTHNTQNRKLKPEVVSNIAASLSAGRYTFTNQSIGFDSNGVLIDGQHRLHAIVKAGVTVPMVVVYGAKQSPYLDRGARRTVADNLTIINQKDYLTQMISTINHMHRLYSPMHKSLDDTKIGIAYDLIRPDIEDDLISGIFSKRSRKAINYTVSYIAAIVILLISHKFEKESIAKMHELFLLGYYDDQRPITGTDQLIISVRDDYVMGRKPFTKGNHYGAAHFQWAEASTYTFMKAMLAYLTGGSRRKTQPEVENFCKDVLSDLFTQVDEAFDISQKKQDSNP